MTPMFHTSVSRIVTAAATVALLAACDRTNTSPEPASTISFRSAPTAVKQMVSRRIPASEHKNITLTHSDAGYSVAYKRAGVHTEMEVKANGQIVAVSETVRYRPLTPSPRNTALEAAASLVEDYVEAELDGRRAVAAKKLAGLVEALPKLRPALRGTFDTVASQARQITKARLAGDVSSAELAAVETYLGLINGFDSDASAVPVGVSQLDYVGFKVTVLTARAEPNWAEIERTAQAAVAYWGKLKSSVHDHGIVDLMERIQRGLIAAAKAKNRLAARFAGQMELDAVDVLEGYFEDAFKTGRGRAQ